MRVKEGINEVMENGGNAGRRQGQAGCHLVRAHSQDSEENAWTHFTAVSEYSAKHVIYWDE